MWNAQSHQIWQKSRPVAFNLASDNGSDEHGFGDTARTVARHVTRNFAAPGGMADVDRVFQIQRVNEFCEIVGVVVNS
jgi:hypothetical protein